MFSLRGCSLVFFIFFLETLPTQSGFERSFLIYFSETLMVSLFTDFFSRLTVGKRDPFFKLAHR